MKIILLVSTYLLQTPTPTPNATATPTSNAFRFGLTTHTRMYANG